MATRRLNVVIAGDAASFGSSLTDATSGMARFGRAARNAGRTMTRGLTLPIAAFGVVAYRELAAGEEALAQTEAAIESTGGAARKSVQDIVDLSASLSELTSLDDEPIQEAANTLLTFRNIAGDTFDEATAATLDLSVALDRDLRGSAIMVGKALNDPLRGMTALGRAGIQFTDEQRNAIEAMVAFGNTAGAQQIILEELNAEFGGSAEALGGTVTGRLNRVKNEMENMGASILEDLMPALEDLAAILSDVAGAYSDLTPKQQKFVAGAVALAAVAGPLTSVLGGLATAIAAVAGALGVSALAMASVAVLAVGVAAGLAWIVVNWDKVRTAASIAVSLMRTNIPGASQVITVLGRNIQLVVGFWRTVATVVRTAIGVITTLSGLTLDGLLGAVRALVAGLERVVSLAQSARDVLGGVGDAIPQGAIAGAAAGANELSFSSAPPTSGTAAPVGVIESGRSTRTRLRPGNNRPQMVYVVGGI